MKSLFLSRLATAGALLLLTAALTSPALAKNKYKKWIEEEVCWIVSRAEENQFKKLPDDAARDQFIELFWKRRDPTPSTDRNEYKEEHYRRLIFARKMFREGVPGWKTDRGRVYILHGPPDSESYYKSLSTISPNRQLPHTTRSPNTLIWTYHQNPSASYYRGEIRLVFQPSSGLSRQSFALSESKTAQDRADQMASRFFPASDPNWLEADVRYKLVMAGPPAIVNSRGADLPTAGMAEAARYIDDFLRSPGDLLEEREREIQRREESKQELRTSARAEISFGEAPFNLDSQAFLRSSGEWLVPLRMSIDLEESGATKLDVYAMLLDASGEIFDEFIDSVQMDAPETRSADAGSTIEYYNSFTAPAGRYTLRVAVREVTSKKMGVQDAKLDLSPTRSPSVRIGGAMLTNRVEMLPEDDDGVGPGQGIVFNRTRLLPNPSGRFLRDDYLFAFIQVWPSASGGKVSLSGKFIRDGQIVGRLDPRELEASGASFADYGTAMPLSGFEAGQYTLQLQAIDHGSKTFDIVRLPFTLLESIDAEPVAAEGPVGR